jgi:hypothetical protein
MKNAIIAAIVAALVASGSTYAAAGHLFGTRIVVSHSDVITTAPGARGFVNASCPPGLGATGGGLVSSDLAASSGAGAFVTDSAPAPLGADRFPTGWTVAVQNASTHPIDVQAYAVCVR